MDHHDLMVKNCSQIIDGLAKDPKKLSISFYSHGFISRSTFDELHELPRTNKDKARTLYSAITSIVRNYPERFNDFIQVLEEDEIMFGDLLTCLTGKLKKGTTSSAQKVEVVHGIKSDPAIVYFTYEKDLKVLYDAAYEARPKWRNIGLQLDVSPSTLESIDTKNRESNECCFYDVLSEWLKTGSNCSLDVFVSALANKTVGYNALSSLLRKNLS